MTTIKKVFLGVLIGFCLMPIFAQAQILVRNHAPNVPPRPLTLEEKKQLNEKTKAAHEARKADCAANGVPEDVCNRSPLIVPFQGFMWKVSITNLPKAALDAQAKAKDGK